MFQEEKKEELLKGKRGGEGGGKGGGKWRLLYLYLPGVNHAESFALSAMRRRSLLTGTNSVKNILEIKNE